MDLERFWLGEVVRAKAANLETAGKPVNAARAFAALGGRASVLGFCGREELDSTRGDLAEAGLGSKLLRLPGRSRICVVLSENSGRETVVNTDSGLGVGRRPLESLGRILESRVKRGDFVLASGSLPPMATLDAVAALLRPARAAGAFLSLDQRGEALKRLLKEKPDYVQANRAEYANTFGVLSGGAGGVRRLLEEVRARGAGAAAFLDGSRGAFLSTPAGTWRLVPPRVRALSPIGAGDAFMGGMLFALSRGESWPEALRWAGASAAANVVCPGACRFSRTGAGAFRSRCKILATA